MLTSFQFAQLAAAAWVGAPVIVSTSATSCQLISGAASSSYTVFYQAGHQPGAAMYSGQGFGCACPFLAVMQAIDKAWEAGALTGRQVEQAQAVVRAAELLFSGAPTPPPTAPAAVCAVCGESADYFGECGCAYVSVPHSHYFNVAA